MTFAPEDVQEIVQIIREIGDASRALRGLPDAVAALREELRLTQEERVRHSLRPDSGYYADSNVHCLMG